MLEVRGLSLEKEDQLGVTLANVSLSLRAGEVLGVAGVAGNGQNQLLAALSGEDRRAPPGSIELLGRDISRASPQRRRKLGLHFVPEERLGRATVPTHSLSDNVLLTRRDSVGPGPLLRKRPLRELARSVIARFGVKAGGPEASASSLSGGNLQKYVVGRELSASPKLLLVAQPTWGVDVGAAAQIRRELLRLRDAGSAVLLVSEELDELFELSDVLVVISNGRVSPRISRRDATRSLIGQWMSGLWPEVANGAKPQNHREGALAEAGAPS